MPLWEPYNAKPPLGAPIDWTRPLCQGLQGFYPANEGAGSKAFDATGRLSLASYGTVGWSSGASGAALSFSGTNAGIGATIPTALRATAWPVTYLVACRFPAAPTAANDLHLGGALYASPAASPFWCWDARWSGPSASNAVVLEWNNGGGSPSYQSQASTFTPATNTDYVLGFEWNASGVKVYAGGVPKYSASATMGSGPAYSATSQFALGSSGVDSGTQQGVLIYWGGWWNRALSAGEHAAIGAGPSAIFGLIFGSPRSSWLFRQSGGATCVGAMGVTLAGDAFSGSGSFADSASMGVTLAGDTFSGSGSFAASGTMAATLAGDTFAASASFTTVASMGVTLVGDTFAGTSPGSSVAGTMAAALASDAFAAAGSFGTAAVMAVALSPDVFAGHGSGPVVGPLLPFECRAVKIDPPAPASPWAIDPERSQQMTPASSGWQASPWSIDPERSTRII